MPNLFAYFTSVSPSVRRLALLLAVLLAVTALSYFGSLKKILEGFSHEPDYDTPLSLTLYHHPSCGHCKAMMPEWQRLEKRNKYAGVNLKMVNGKENPTAVDKAGVASFPTIILSGQGKKKIYSGERTAEALERFIARGL